MSECVNTALSQEDKKKIRNERTIGRDWSIVLFHWPRHCALPTQSDESLGMDRTQFEQRQGEEGRKSSSLLPRYPWVRHPW